MSNTRRYSDATLSIMSRFYLAVDKCKEEGLMRSVAAYCSMAEIDKGHFYNQKKYPTKGYFEVGWMTPLVNDLGVSANWLLTGRGTMFVR